MAQNLALTNPTFDATGQKFGSGALNGGYGTAPMGLLTGTPWAIGVWFKINTPITTTQVLAGQFQCFWIGLNADGTLHGEYGGAPGYSPIVFNGTSAVSTGVWHFAALSLSGAAATLTIDGAVVASGPYGSTQASYSVGSGTGFLTVGNHANSGTTYLFTSGEIDEVSVWNADKFPGAFTVPASAYAGSEPGLLALWHLDGRRRGQRSRNASSTPRDGIEPTHAHKSRFRRDGPEVRLRRAERGVRRRA